MFEFSSSAHAFWRDTFGFSSHTKEDPTFSIRIEEKIPSTHPVMKLHRDDDKIFVIMTSEFAQMLVVTKDSSLLELEDALRKAQMKWYDEDGLYYLADVHRARLLESHNFEGVRQLSEADSALFSNFEKRNSKQDLDDVEVELDNEAVFGFIYQESLACVADYYLWPDSDLADIGVLTVPAWRGKGVASKVVESICRHALTQGLLPQYRCQLDNLASIGVAKRLGLQRYGLWTVGVPIES